MKKLTTEELNKIADTVYEQIETDYYKNGGNELKENNFALISANSTLDIITRFMEEYQKMTTE